MEIWKSIVGYEGRYEVSDKGRVRSVKRYIKDKLGRTWTQNARILSQHDNGKGYIAVNLWKNNKGKRFYVHILVAQAFIPNPENKLTVNHIDGNKANNHVENLEWATYRENNLHAIRTGLNKHGCDNPQRYKKISKAVIQLTMDGEFVAEYPSMREAERQTGLCNGSISKVCLGEWKQIKGTKWKLKSYDFD